MIRIITLLICLFTLHPSFCQFNDTTNYYVSYASTGVINKTNQAASYVLTNALRFSVKKKSITLNNNTSWMYGQQQNRLTNNDFNSTLDFNLYKTFEHFYYWGLLNYEKSYSLNINNRLQTGLGVAYSFFDRPDAFLNLSNGILYESSDININDSTNQFYNTFRNSFRIRYRFAIKELLMVLDGTGFLQNALRNDQDYILRNVTNLSIRLRKWLSFTTSANFNKIRRTNRENLLVTFGLRAETYF